MRRCRAGSCAEVATPDLRARRCRVSSVARLSVPVSAGVARPPIAALASFDGETSTSSGPRPPGSNRPLRIDRSTALTSTPSPSVGTSGPLAGVLSSGPQRRSPAAALIFDSGPDRSRSRSQLGDDGVKPLALDELHGVKADVAILAHLVNRHDVGVVQPCRGAGLAAEPLLDHPVAGHMSRQDLERHAAAQRDLLGLVHDAHAAPADLAEDPVVADLKSGSDSRPGNPGLAPPRPADPSTCSTLTIAGNSSRMSSARSGYRSVYSLSAGRSPRRKRSANSSASRSSRSYSSDSEIDIAQNPSRPPGIAARIDLSFFRPGCIAWHRPPR